MQKWVFAESLRRTIVIAYCFLKLYDMLRGVPDNGGIVSRPNQ